MAKTFLLSLLIFLVVALWALLSWIGKVPLESLRKTEIILGGKTFKVDVAESFSTRATGLSGRSVLGEDEGMLFIFPFPGIYSFWMRGMNFPLDIVWISGNRIVGIAENVPVSSGLSLPTYSPPGPIDKVVELNAGVASKLELKIGDSISIK
ncbi:MAG: hypothetical protein G01um101419_459 [Parcubacteria group bacterium Gr01-1014_19]|nr:MAG: hypothetical protein G01um101419_459 [Parcubacteria group bacterium Gr01-1014_19]